MRFNDQSPSNLALLRGTLMMVMSRQWKLVDRSHATAACLPVVDA
jgi:hypothetical protein